MSVLLPPKQNALRDTDAFVTPSASNVWTAGTQAPAAHPALIANNTQGIRSGHQDLWNPNTGCHAAFHPEIEPRALSAPPLTSSQMRLQGNALSELRTYTQALAQPVQCHLVPQLSDSGVRRFETTAALTVGRDAPNLETVAKNFKDYNLVGKYSFSHGTNSHFAPFTVALKHDDLTNCMLHATANTDGGMSSKFLDVKVGGTPHSVLFHIVQDPQTSKHYLYGFNLTHKDTYSH